MITFPAITYLPLTALSIAQEPTVPRIDIDNDKKFIDFNPLTTREERQTLDAVSLSKIRAERRTTRNEIREENGGGVVNKLLGLGRSLQRMALRIGFQVDEDVLRKVGLVVVANLLDVPDPDGDGWEPAEVAVECRVAAVEQVDEWFRPLSAEDPIMEMLRSNAITEKLPVDKAIHTALLALEAMDDRIINALFGPAIEDFFLHMFIVEELGEASEGHGFTGFMQALVDRDATDQAED